MTYYHKSGKVTDKITISVWVFVTQTELDDAFAAGSFSWGSVRSRIPIFTLGSTIDTQIGYHTGHVFGEIPTQIGDRGTGGDGGELFAKTLEGDPPKYEVTASFTYPGNGFLTYSDAPVNGQFAGTTDLIHTGFPSQGVLASLSWDFSNVLFDAFDDSAPPISITWGGGANPFAGVLGYSFDVQIPHDLVAISPTVLVINDGFVEFHLAEYISRASREFPTQRFWEFDEWIGTQLTMGKWNHVFATLDLSNQASVKAAVVVNNADRTVQTANLSGVFGIANPMQFIGGEQVGLPITPQEDSLHFSCGKNSGIRFAFLQAWLGKYIEPTEENLSKFLAEYDNKLYPVGGQIASDAFGAPDIWLERDNLSGVEFEDNMGTAGEFTVVGTAPVDFSPGPEDEPLEDVP